MEHNPYKPELTGIAITRAVAEALGWHDLEEREGWYETPENGDFEIDVYGTSPDGKRDRYFGRCADDAIDALRVCRLFCTEYRFVLELEWYEADYPYYRAQAAFRDMWGTPAMCYVTNSFSAPGDDNPNAGAISRLILKVLELPEYAIYRDRAEHYRAMG